MTCIQKFEEGLARTVQEMHYRFDDTILDPGPRDWSEIGGSLRVAGCALVTLQPAGLDMWTLGELDDIVAARRDARPELRAFIVFNRALTKPRDLDLPLAVDVVKGCCGLIFNGTVLRDRVSFRRVRPGGITASEYRPIDHKAAHELQSVYDLAFDVLRGDDE